MERDLPQRLDERCYEALRASLDDEGRLPGSVPLLPTFTEQPFRPAAVRHMPDRSFLPQLERMPSLVFQTA